MGLVDRARKVPRHRSNGMDLWIASHEDPETLRAEIVEALLDPTISYRAIWLVLRADGLPYRDPGSLRHWWLAQPEALGGPR